MKKFVISTVVVIALIAIYKYWFNSPSSENIEVMQLSVTMNSDATSISDTLGKQKVVRNNVAQSCLEESQFLLLESDLQHRYSQTTKQLQTVFTELTPKFHDNEFTLKHGALKHINPESGLSSAFLNFQHGGKLEDLKSALKQAEVPANIGFNGYALFSAIMLKQQLDVNEVLALLELGLTVQFEDLVHATLTFHDVAVLQILNDHFSGDIATEWRRHGSIYNLSLISAESLNLAALEFWNSLGVKNYIAGEDSTALDFVPFPTQFDETISIANTVDYLVRADVTPRQQMTYIRLANWLTRNASDTESLSARLHTLSPELIQKLNGLMQQYTETYHQLLSHRESYRNCFPNADQPLTFVQNSGFAKSENRYIDEVNTHRERLEKSATTAAENEIVIALSAAAANQDVNTIMQLLNEHNDKPTLNLERAAIFLLLKADTDPDKMQQLLDKSPLPTQVLIYSVFKEDLTTLKKLGRYQFEVDLNDKDGAGLIAMAKSATTNADIIEYLQQRLTKMEH